VINLIGGDFGFGCHPEASAYFAKAEGSQLLSFYNMTAQEKRR